MLKKSFTHDFSKTWIFAHIKSKEKHIGPPHNVFPAQIITVNFDFEKAPMKIFVAKIF